ncbi:MAG TPA: AAA family ATPase, partial [Xanthobacteraceae bacterium]
MALRIITADQRLAEAHAKTTMAIFGSSGVGKTSLLKTLPPAETLCIDLEAGMKSVQDWPGDSIPVRSFADALDIGCLIGGVNPAADEKTFFCGSHYRHL